MTFQTAIAAVASAPSAGVAACAVAAMSSACPSVFASFGKTQAGTGKSITKRGSAGTDRTNEEHRNTWSMDRDNQGSCGAVEVSRF